MCLQVAQLRRSCSQRKKNMTFYVWILLFGALVLTKAQDLDLSDALGDPDPTPKPAEKPPKPGGNDLDLSDALHPEAEKPKDKDPKQPAVPAQGGGDLSDSDLLDVGEDGYKPDPNRGGRAGDNTDNISDTQDDQPNELYQQWLKLLMVLGDNMPEGLHAWIANSKQVVVSLLEKLLELLDLAEAEKQS
ncbi:CD99 molecule isoform X3 [Ictalurus punctatus]|uniref:CD99 molecule isoform X3 n=1 Tax=Ictalurus punctatus TaxID=7998 RepID=A0A2D0Q7T1_ICTPU|nr:CD99 molecule isoform X3 [Ictalurus punctatus]